MTERREPWHDEIELYLGALLSSEHEQCREMIAEIYGATRMIADQGGEPEVVNEAISLLGEIPTVEILEQRDFNEDEDYRCAEWAFGTQLGEEWALRGFTVDAAPELWRDPMGFLAANGYDLVRRPEFGDVVAYGGVTQGRVWFEHFALYGDDGVVVSKFGQGPIAEHDLQVVSAVWGDRYWLYRRRDRIYDRAGSIVQGDSGLLSLV